MEGSIGGLLLIGFSIAFILIGTETHRCFDSELRSSGDVQRLNEWVFKPFLTISLFVLGILLLMNRENFPFKLKIFYLVIIGLTGFCELFNNFFFNFMVSAAAFVAVLRIQEKSRNILKTSTFDPQGLKGTADEKAFTLIEKGFLPRDIDDILLQNYWKGSIAFPLFFAIGILIFSAPITINKLYESSEPYEFVAALNNVMVGVVIVTLMTGILLCVNDKFVPRIVRMILPVLYLATSIFIFWAYGVEPFALLLLILAGTCLWLALQPVPSKLNR